MSNRLTYKKIFIDSKYRTEQSKSSSDFSIELNEKLETPEGTRMYVTDISIGAVWKTTEVGFYEYMYVMVFNGDTLVTDLTAGGIFVYSYSSATRTVEIKVKDGLPYTIKIPTDDELENYVNGIWDSVSAPYDSRKTVSINYLLSNFVPTNPIATWTSSYLNLVPFRYVFITSNSLSDYRYSAPNSYSSSINRKVLCTEQLGGIINDNHSVHQEDYIDIGGRNLKRLDFKITDETGTVMNRYNIDVQFALLISHPSY